MNKQFDPHYDAILSRISVNNMREPAWIACQVAILIDGFNKGESRDEICYRLGTFGCEALRAMAGPRC